MSTIKKLTKKPALPKRKKVAAYCRVSTLNEEQETSYELQVSHYTRKIQSNPEWEYAGVYADHGISGTGIKNRLAFQEMMKAAEEGKINLILTKSIKRFARNTVDLLNTIRRLKELQVEVYFEQENIHTLSEDGDLMISLLAAFAQEESVSLSNNIKWAVKKHFENGEPWTLCDCYGYKSDGRQLHQVPEQAKVVKRIYREFLSGSSLTSITAALNAEKIPTFSGCLWTIYNVKKVLTNINYTGNLILQKTYIESPIGRKQKRNHGEVDQYFVLDTHETLVSLEDWQKVQSKFKKSKKTKPDTVDNPFQGKVFCGRCKSPYWFAKDRFICSHQTVTQRQGISQTRCASVPLYALEEAVEGLDGWEKILVCPNRELVVFLNNGQQITHRWRSRAYDSRKEFYEGRKSKMSTRSGNHLAKRYGELACFVKCEKCGANYRRGSYTPKKKPGRLFHTNCGHVPKFREDEMKSLIADVLGLDEFDVDAMDAALSHATVCDKRVTFHFHDGRTEVRYLHG